MERKLIGIILIIIGAFLAYWGYDIYQSVGSELTRTLGGETPWKAWAGMVGGAICIVLGIARAV
ncbi:DUF3185 family protein [Thalassotalea maritima]|uniref:DUF3185 family protein n=1 Tax=Thalassotalea maritima TaxID=3242416 RepID=UPI003527B0B5